ncbi:unnamed protein product [Rotaria magnacalcarata]
MATAKSKNTTSNSRFLDEPLFPLEDAVQPISDQLEDLDLMVDTAKDNSKKPADGLTSNESAAIHLYTLQWEEPNVSLYTKLNNTLRSERREPLKPWFRYLKLILTALYKLPSLRTTVWRGVLGNLTDQYDENHIWWGFSSCTENMEIMEQFVGKSGVRTIFNIECINGKSIKAHSFYKKENEILLLPGIYFRVVGKWSPSKDLYMIHLRETPPPRPYLEPPFAVTSSAEPTSRSSTPKTTPKEQPKLTPKSIKKPPQYQNKELVEELENSQSNLWLDGRNLTDKDMQIVAYNLLRNNNALTHLYLSSNQIGDAGAQSLADALRENKTLTELNLRANEIGDAGAQSLADALRKKKTLNELDLSYNQIGDVGAQSLANVLRENKTLTNLDLQHNRIGAAGAQSLADALQENKTLIKLNLTYNQIGDAGAQSFADALRANRTLNELHLRGNEIGDAGAQSFADALRANRTLNELNLHQNEIGAAGAQSLADVLRENKTLNELSLGANKIGDAGAQSFADVLQENKTLTKLNLQDNEIGDTGAQFLAEALRENKTLNELGLT